MPAAAIAPGWEVPKSWRYEHGAQDTGREAAKRCELAFPVEGLSAFVLVT